MGDPLRDVLATYARVASIALPLVLAALAYLFYEDIQPREPSAAHALPAATDRERGPSLPVAQVFNGIYADAAWGTNDAGEPSSGSGSTLASTVLYRAFLQAFLKEHDIHSVVDAGCGDWEFSQAMDWRGIDYRGYDVVPSVIARDRAKFGAANVKFTVADIIEEDLPPADLLIVKHVLQHLTNADVARFITQFPKYKHVLLTDGVDAPTLSSANTDIPRGQYRTLDLTRPPFNVRGLKALTWWDGYDMHQVLHVLGHR